MADEVADYMNQTMLHLGATTIGKVAVLVGADPNAIGPAEKQAKELAGNWLKLSVQDGKILHRKNNMQNAKSILNA